MISKTLPSSIHKLITIIIKLPLLKFLDFLNLFHKQPIFDKSVANYNDAPSLEELKDKFDEGILEEAKQIINKREGILCEYS